MKTYEEMAQSVIRRAKAHKAARNRWIIGSVAAVLALCLCVGIMLLDGPADETTLQTMPTTEPGKLQTPVETTAAVPESAKVTFLYDDGDEINEMKKNIETPCRMEIRVKDIRGLSRDEVDAVCEAEKQYAQALVDAHSEGKGYLYMQSPRINTVITSITAGAFIIGMDDPTQIESIYATVQGAVQLQHIPFAHPGFLEDPTLPWPTEYLLDHDSIQKQYWAPNGGVSISFHVSNDAEMKLDQGTVTIGELRDTITFTVTYCDGTVENHVIDMIFNESGQVYALYRGATAAA